MATGVPADVLTEVVTLKFQLIVKDFPIFFFLSVSLQDANFFANWQKSSFFSLSFLQWFSSSCFFFFFICLACIWLERGSEVVIMHVLS